MERELNEQEINLERENIVVGGIPIENFYTKTEVNELLETKADSDDIPTLTSELTNDSGFIVSETDPVFSNSVAHNITSNDITAWNNKSNFSGSYNDLNDKPTIPTNLSELNDDTTHRTVTDTEKSSWNNKSDFSGSYTDLSDKPTLFSGDYNDLTNKPTIPTVPTNVSSFTNDSGYLASGDLKTINGNSIVGSGDITISGGYSDYAIPTYCLRTTSNFSSGTKYTGSNFSSADLQKMSNIITDAYANGYFNFSLILSYENSGYYNDGFAPFFLASMGNILNKQTSISFLSNALVQNRYSKGDTRRYNSALISISGSWNGDVFTATRIQFYNNIYDMLTLDNERPYTPTSDYHPSTKKYVDDSIASAITTTLGGSF